MKPVGRASGTVVAGLLALVLSSVAAQSLDKIEFRTPGASKELRGALRSASLLQAAEQQGGSDAQDLFAAARADYGRLLGTLYAEGYYSGVIRIFIDGREAAGIAPLDAPQNIRLIRIIVEPGPQFRFSKARMKPYARGTNLPPSYGDTAIARSTAIRDAAAAGVDGWRNIGHAKASVAGQSIVADHRASTIDAEILLDPGPRVRFGKLHISGQQRMNPRRLYKIADFPTGEVFDPAAAEDVAERLRRTGVFRSVALSEAEVIGPDDTLDYDLVVSEEALRRIGFGGELDSSDGLSLSAYWLHRNLLGGGERLRFDAQVTGIDALDADLGYNFGVRLDRPATPRADMTGFVEAQAERYDLVDQTIDSLSFGLGFTRVFTDRLSGEVGLSYVQSTARDDLGSTDYRLVALPGRLTWDSRNDALDPVTGYFLQTGVTPFLGFDATGSGAQITGDARAYRGFGEDERFVLAGRAQIGAVVGSTLTDTPPDFRFYSGGAGTVRGQPYQSLGVPIGQSGNTTIQTGGQSFAGFSAELRAGITEKIGAVAFYDIGYVGPDDSFGSNGNWHSGAGLGVRYDTGIGPIRFDIGFPVSGSTGSGVQLYVGIGQSF